MKNFDIDDLLKSVFEKEAEIDLRQVFERKLDEYNISKTRALNLLKIDKHVFEDLINGEAKQPNLIHVIKLADFLEINVERLIKEIIKNQKTENIKSIENARKTRFILQNFDVKQLTKLGFFNAKDDTDALIKKVLHFFDFDSIHDYEKELVKPLFSNTKRNFSDKMKEFWVKSAYSTFKLINNPNPYNRNQLKDLIVKLKPYTQDVENGLFTVCKALYNVGVTVIFQDYLSTTQVRGGTFYINKKPCIVITDFNKKYSTLWFTLMHELHHVLFDLDLIESNNYHLTGNDDLFLIEDKANSFARDYFLPIEKFKYIKNYINNPFIVQKFANENEIHVSLIYTFFTWYMNDLYNKNYHGAFKSFYPMYKKAVSKLNPITWNDEKLSEVAIKIKSVLEIK
ncbi:MAG: hypothetical protein LAT51_12945 [Flavobacteriaceae bacterium]|nr:hypothetical protein [Flavobacteriaceae bacterium]